jgi:hypothetical protein
MGRWLLLWAGCAADAPGPARSATTAPTPAPAPAPAPLPDTGDTAGPTDTTSSGTSAPREHLLVTDGSGTVFRIDLAGAIVQQWDLPATSPVGVAWDRASNDGFWLSPASGELPFVKLALDGSELATVHEPDFVYEGRTGLDHTVPFGDYPTANPVLSVIGWNRNDVQGSLYVDVVTNERVQAASFMLDPFGTFLDGFWGIAHEAVPTQDVTRPAPAWCTRGNQIWYMHSTVQDGVITTPYEALYGITALEDGTLWVVDAAADRLVHLDALGVELGAIPAPGAAPLDVSWMPASAK